MKKTVLFISITLSFLIGFGCQGKPEKVEKAEQKEATKAELKGKSSIQFPHSVTDLKKWVDDAEKNADKDTLKKLEKFTDNFSAGEIIKGIAVRPLPEYWDNITDKDKRTTLSIMNTAFSKARIDAGYADNVEALNSNLYLEDETEKIIAVSDSNSGAKIL